MDEAGGSGPATCTGTVPYGVTIDTATLGSKTFTVDATDVAGNHSTQSVTYSVVDVTAPTVTTAVTPNPNADGWVTADATVRLDAVDEDGGSGLASLTLGSATGTGPSLTTTVSAEGTTTVPYTATDVAGNTTSGSVAVKVDTAAPTVTITSPTNGATVAQGTAVTAAYSCGDATSLVASCVGSVADGAAIDTSTPGPKTLTVTATDHAGNVTTETRSITVTPTSHDHVAVKFSGGLTANYDSDLAGQVIIKKTHGQITSATATGTVPGAAGGRATIRISVQRVAGTSLFVGAITVTDPSTHLSQTTPIVGNVTASGSKVTGTNSWFTSKLARYSVKWTITDAG